MGVLVYNYDKITSKILNINKKPFPLILMSPEDFVAKKARNKKIKACNQKIIILNIN